MVSHQGDLFKALLIKKLVNALAIILVIPPENFKLNTAVLGNRPDTHLYVYIKTNCVTGKATLFNK